MLSATPSATTASCRRRGRLSTLALAAVLAIAGSSAALAQTRGGTLRAIVQPEPPTLMLGLNQQIPTQYVAGKIYESLLTWTTDLKPQPGLARAFFRS